MVVSFETDDAEDSYVRSMTDVKESEQLAKKGQKFAEYDLVERPLEPFKHQKTNPLGKMAASPTVDIDGGAKELRRQDTHDARRVEPGEDLVVVAHGMSFGPFASQAGMKPEQMALFVQQFLPKDKASYTGTLDFAGCLTARKTALRKASFTEEVLTLVKAAGWSNAKARGYRGIVHAGEYGSEPLEFHTFLGYKKALKILNVEKQRIDEELRQLSREAKRDRFLEFIRTNLAKEVSIGLQPVVYD